jgi:hypothetical protein
MSFEDHIRELLNDTRVANEMAHLVEDYTVGGLGEVEAWEVGCGDLVLETTVRVFFVARFVRVTVLPTQSVVSHLLIAVFWYPSSTPYV